MSKTLTLVMDEGSVGFAGTWFLLHGWKVRLLPVRDPHHREWNDVKLAIADSSLWWVVLLGGILFNLPFGPWANQAFFHKLQEAARFYFSEAQPHDMLFEAFFDSICRDR
eukprot:8519757-Lingulodinium_polyedra.AAC.1